MTRPAPMPIAEPSLKICDEDYDMECRFEMVSTVGMTINVNWT